MSFLNICCGRIQSLNVTIAYYNLVDSDLISYTGVDSVSLTDEDYEMADKLFTMGAEGFLRFLDNLKTAAEMVVEERKINETG